MVDSANVFDQWSTARPYFTYRPSWVGSLDGDRIAAYDLYEQMYWGTPNIFKLIQRGSDAKPIYIPSGRQIVETMHRYLAPRLEVIPDPNLGSSAEQAAAQVIVTSLMRRERFYSNFSAAKRYGIIRGDWVFHILADPELDEGSRISLVPVDPGQYFPVYNDDNINEQIGVDLAEPVVSVQDGNTYIYKLSYRKTTGRGGPSPIEVSEGIFKVDKSGLPGMEDGAPLTIIREPEELPSEITQIPVYHFMNFAEDGSPWGSSEMRGLERIMAAVNQGISDEELTLAMEGLGVYATDAGTPVDEETKEPVPWNLGPAKVIELPDGKTFQRVSGVQSLQPYQDHLQYLHQQLDASATTPQIAKGNVDVQIAQSGIALQLHMSPILARTEEKELSITDVLSNMLYDLGGMWLPAYETESLGSAQLIPKYGDKIPLDRTERFSELTTLATIPGLVSMAWIRGELKKLGYEFPTDAAMMTAIIDEQNKLGQAAADAASTRLAAEMAALGQGGGGAGGPGNSGATGGN